MESGDPSGDSSALPAQNVSATVSPAVEAGSAAAGDPAVPPAPVAGAGDAPVVDTEAENKRKVSEYLEAVSQLAASRAAERQRAASAEYPEDDFYSTLDSKLKSCTGYIKKLKNLTESQHDTLDKDFHGLNLRRYVSEATQALAEAKLKVSDVPTALHVSGLLQRRYADFASSMLDSWRRVLPLTRSDPVSNPSKLRVDLKFLPEQLLTGLIPLKPALALLKDCLAALIDQDKDDRQLLPLLTVFAKNFALDFLGVHPKKMRLLAEQAAPEALPLPPPTFLPPETLAAFKALLDKYFDALSRQLESENQRLRDLEKAHRRLMASRGDVPADRLDKYDAFLAQFNKLKNAMLVLGDAIDRELPVLAPREELEDTKMTIELLTVDIGDRAGLAPIWNDEDERDLYENLPDLKATMPSMAYKDSLAESASTLPPAPAEDPMTLLDAVIQADAEADAPGTPEAPPEAPKAAAEAPAPKETKTESVRKPVALPRRLGAALKGGRKSGLADLLDTLYEGEEGDGEEEPGVAVEEEYDSVTSALRQILDAFIVSLPKVSSKEAIDKMAVDFCTNLNRRNYRRRLVAALYGVPRNRPDLLPLYARLVAILNPVMPDVGGELSEALRRQFRWLVRKQDPLRLESKIRNVRFMAELTKFTIVPRAETLLALKILLNNFKHHNVEMACSLLEHAGRFLYWSPDSHPRMKILVEEFLRRKGLQHFDARIESMIENAYLACATPETANRRSASSRVLKVRTPMQLFIRKLFLSELNTGADPTVLMGLLRRLAWDEPATLEYGVRYLSAAWKLNYAAIPALASILAGLANYQDDVAVRVVDNVLEDIRVHLELNNPKFNQRRLAMVRYLAEMYNYRIVESSVIFNTLYSLVLFGWVGDAPTSLDPPEHLLRLRLVCVLLSTCGEYFSHGAARRRLDQFLVLFRRYLWLKKESPVWNERTPFPLTIQHLVEDTLGALRRDFPLLKSLAEADEALNKLNQKLQEKVNVDSVSAAAAVGGKKEEPVVSSASSSESGSRYGSNVDLTLLSGGEEQPPADGAALVTEEPPPAPVTAEDVDFMAVFDRLSSESYQSQAASKVPQFKSAIPSTVKEQLQTSHAADANVGTPLHPATPGLDAPDADSGAAAAAAAAAAPGSAGLVRVGLMTKKGQKQHHIKFMEMPADTEYVTLWRAAEEHERQERSEMLRLTLDMSQRQEREEYEALMGSVSRPLPAGGMRPRLPLRAPTAPGPGGQQQQQQQRAQGYGYAANQHYYRAN